MYKHLKIVFLSERVTSQFLAKYTADKITNTNNIFTKIIATRIYRRNTIIKFEKTKTIKK